MRSIKIIHEDVTDRDADYKQAQQLLQEAKQIFFLGFGFNTVNVARLGISSITATEVFATAIGYVQNEINGLVRLCSPSRIDFFDAYDCLDILRNKGTWG